MRTVLITLKFESEAVNLVVELRDGLSTVDNFYKLLTSSRKPYKGTKLTRVVSPEFIIQGGEIPDLNTILDNQDLTIENTKFYTTPGLVVAAATPNKPSTQFFVTLNDLSRFEYLQKYVIIGHVIKGLDKLIHATKDLKVDADDVPMTDIVIVRTNELKKKEGKSEQTGPWEQQQGVEGKKQDESFSRDRDSSRHDHRSQRRHQESDRRRERSSRRHHGHRDSDYRHRSTERQRRHREDSNDDVIIRKGRGFK